MTIGEVLLEALNSSGFLPGDHIALIKTDQQVPCVQVGFSFRYG